MPKRVPQGDPLVAIAYVRVSTEDQNLGPDAQRAALARWSAQLGIRIAATFEDHGVSGATPVSGRPSLIAALEALREHGAGVLAAAKRDRFARDVVVAAAVESCAKSAGAVVRTADGSSDAPGPEGGLMRGMVDVFGQYEREVIRARTRAALAVKKSRGERVGEVAYGFRVSADGIHLEAHPEEQAVKSAACELRAEGRSAQAVANELAARGMVSRSGRPFGGKQIWRMTRGGNNHA